MVETPTKNAVVPGGKTVTAVAGGIAAAAGIAVLAKAMQTPEALTRQKSMFSDYTFPEDLVADNRSFFMTMQFMDYERRSIFNQPFLQAKGGIRLPIPNNLVDTQAVTFEKEAAGPAAGAAIEQGLKGRNSIGGGGGGMAETISNIANAAKGAALGSIVGAPKALASAAGIGGLVDQALQLTGLAQNPFLTVLFKQPEFKRHQFSWKLSPNNYRESNTLRDIISTIKSNMLPAMAPSAGGTLLTYPSMLIISLSPIEEYLYKFKPCVIESMSVNYAPAGLPSFFKRTSAPTEVTLSLSLLEIEYWLKEDIVDPSGGMRMRAGDL